MQFATKPEITHITLGMLLHYFGKLKIQIFCRDVCCDEFAVPQIDRKTQQVKEQWHEKFYLLGKTRKQNYQNLWMKNKDRKDTSSSAMAERPRELDQRFQVGVNLRLNYRLRSYFSRHCDITQFTLMHHMVNKPFLLHGVAAEYRSRRWCDQHCGWPSDVYDFITLTGELSLQRLRRSVVDFYSTSSSAITERPHELGDFKKARVNGGTNNHCLKGFSQVSSLPLTDPHHMVIK